MEVVRRLVFWYNTARRMRDKTTSCALARDMLEWDVPEEVLAVLLKDRSTGRNLIWATDDYVARGKVMDWNAGELAEFRAIAENGGGHGQ